MNTLDKIIIGENADIILFILNHSSYSINYYKLLDKEDLSDVYLDRVAILKQFTIDELKLLKLLLM